MNQKNYQAIENRRQKETFSGQKPPGARKLSGPQKPASVQKPPSMPDQTIGQNLDKESIFGPEKTREPGAPVIPATFLCVSIPRSGTP